MTPLQLPLLNQIWDPLLGMKDAVVLSPYYLPGPPRDARKCDSSTLSGGGTGTLD